MRRNLTVAALIAVMAALAWTNPYVAQAARAITGADISNGSVTTKDIKNGTIKGLDVKDGSLTRADLAAGTLTTGPQGATGPQGPAGPQGATGAQGAAGSASAYAWVLANDGPTPQLVTSFSKNVLSVERTNLGMYCVELAPTVSNDVPVALTLEWNGTAPPEGNGTVLYRGTCGANGVSVTTERQEVNAGVLGSSQADDVAFTLLVP